MELKAMEETKNRPSGIAEPFDCEEAGNPNLAPSAVRSEATERKAQDLVLPVRSFAEHAYDAVTIALAEPRMQGARIAYVNPAFTRMTGFTPQDLVGEAFGILHGPNTDPGILERLDRNLRQGRSFAGQLLQYRKDGTTFVADVRIDALRDAEDRITHWIAIQRDTTERTRVEQTLRELHRIATAQRLPFDEKLMALLERGCSLFNLPIGILSHVVGEDYEVIAVVTPDQSIHPGDVFELGKTYCQETLRSNGPIGFEHASASEWLNHPCYREFKLEAYLGVPVVAGNVVYGTLNFSSLKPQVTHFTATDEKILKLMAQWVGSELARRHAEDALRRVVAGTSAVIGVDFFRDLVRHVAAALEVRYVEVTELVDGQQKRARTLAVWCRDGYAEDFEYDLAGTPCEQILNQSLCVYPCGFAERFPCVRSLLGFDAQCYIGISLADDHHEALGVLAVAHDKPLRDTTLAESIVSVFAARASAEILRMRSEEALCASEERFKDFAETAADWFWELDDRLRFTYLSERYEGATGLRPEQALGQTVRAYFSGRMDDTEKWAEYFRRLEARQAIECFEFVWTCADGATKVLRVSGKPIVGPAGRFQGYRGTGRDITEAHRMAQEMAHQAHHDALTGLVNRQAFEHRLARVLETARVQKIDHALCYLDLDQFKIVNDTCGHVAGDELLRQLGRLLQAQVRKRDTLARLGGDEFGVLMEGCSIEQARRVAETLRSAVEGFRFFWEGKSFGLGASIGLVPITEASASVIQVLRAADSACYAAKDAGRNRVHVYGNGDAELARRHGEMQWVTRVTRALAEDRFHLRFQPIVPIAADDRERAHDELLLRMVDEAGQTVPPRAFLPAAERYNIAFKLDCWVVRTAFTWLAAHPRHLARLHLCHINLSGLSLGNEEFLAFVLLQFEQTGIVAEKICFEITETAVIANLADGVRFVEVLRARGCRFALDDFGSGLSSFAYLKSLPVDFLKIDGVFVRDIVDSPVSLAMVRSINEIGHVLGKQTIAEFVESEAILEKLREVGVDYGQGYHLGRPRPIEELG